MEQIVELAIDEVRKINFDDYEDDEFAIARLGFLSTRPNSHGLDISEEVLRQYTPTALGKPVVAKLFNGDATTHLPGQNIMGYVPRDQEVEFVIDKDGYLRAYVDAVISKVYAKEYCDIFEEDNCRSVSVEMKVVTANGDGLNDIVESLKIVGITTLGKNVKPSCPESDIQFIRFSEDAAQDYFHHVHKDSLATLKKFAKERKEQMAEKTYKIDKSKEAMSDTPWGDVDKIELRNKVMEASNRDTLVDEVYLLVEDGWEEAPSEHLKYPVMELKGDTFVYNRDALASALGYAKQEGEDSVVNKVEKIYKSLDLEVPGKEDEKMSEIEFSAVVISDLWSKLWDALHQKYPLGEYGSVYCVVDIYEENNQKFAIIQHRDEEAKYRLDFSLTEEGIVLNDEIVKVEVEIVETEEIRKFAEPENVEQYRQFTEEESNKKTAPEQEDTIMAELKEQIAKLEADIVERDNIIMEKDAELSILRDFKAQCEEAEKMAKVESVLDKYAKFMSKEMADAFREEGKICKFAEVDGWANRVKASIADEIVSKVDKPVEPFTRMSAPVEVKKSASIWDRL